MEIWKVKAKDGEKIVIRYSRREGDLLTLESYEEPLPALREALQALAVDVETICDLAPGAAESITVLGITLTDSEDSVRALITATRKLANGATLCLNTPCLPYESKHGPQLSGPTKDRIEAVCCAAAEYVNGERAQGELPLDEVSEAAKPIEEWLDGMKEKGITVTVERGKKVQVS